MSGSIRVRSSSFNSLQQIPSSRVLRAHFDSPDAEAYIGHTGGFLGLGVSSPRLGRGTEAGLGVALEDIGLSVGLLSG